MMEIHSDPFRNLFSKKIIDLQLLRKLCYTGISKDFRAETYLIMLGINSLNLSLGPRNEKRFFGIYKRRLDHLKHYEIKGETVHQIEIDIQRINPSCRIFGGYNASYVYRNILLVISREYPEIGYIQGMADLISPFICLLQASFRANNEAVREAVRGIDHELNSDCGLNRDGKSFAISRSAEEAEALTYSLVKFLVSKMIRHLHNYYKVLLEELEQVLSRLFPSLLSHLALNGVTLHTICFRWFSCLFLREFNLSSWYRIFDSMISDDFDDFLVFFAAALLSWHQKRILLHNLEGIMLMMQNIQKDEFTAESIEELIGNTNYLRRIYKMMT